ncbi:hypothetical protein [Sphingomicrobium nitratireducens]|uniref:hypothetical protein n=1 Tax=Sphingomicrobium nitratireducens TaxID=2964666 RepID=UPI00224080D5|nr:hypothetical protein [Sphingomicrobium nitratireducens]
MMTKKTLLAIGVTSLAVLGATSAYAQARSTPKGFDYEIIDGKRVPKAKRTVNADGSWREERRQGNCSEVKEKTASGEIKITRTCDPD